MTAAQVLVVEDESIVAKGIEYELQRLGYGVPAVASSGEEALRKAAETSPDLVLMDIVLKGQLDGVETAEELRQRFDIPVVYLTAYADDQTLKRAKTTDPYGYLVKPFEEKELRTTIEIALYRHKLEAISKEMQQWRAAIFRSIGDGVVVTDARGCVRLANRVAERLTGWPDEDAFGEELSAVLPLVDERTGTARGLPTARELLKKGTVDLGDHCLLITRAGGRVPVEGTVAPIQNNRGGFGGYVIAFRDVTERRRAAEALRQSEEQLRQLQKIESLGRLASGMAHDFNQVLAHVCASLSLVLSRLPEGDPNREDLLTAELVALHGAEVVRQLFTFARRTASRPEPLNLNSSLRPTVDLLRRLIDPRVAIDFKPAPDLWAVRADPGQINEVVMNLGLNARDAMPDGGTLLLETANVVVENPPEGSPGARPGEFVCLRFSDTGRGIPPDVRARVYEPFFTTKEPGKATGLGLALVSAVVEHHGGWIDCRSEADRGTRFEVYLPRCGDQPRECEPAA
jgi:two-component system, cell cycle sensor histidine kinase and response regulator CckA